VYFRCIDIYSGNVLPGRSALTVKLTLLCDSATLHFCTDDSRSLMSFLVGRQWRLHLLFRSIVLSASRNSSRRSVIQWYCHVVIRMCATNAPTG
jgi:hypothetical protein